MKKKVDISYCVVSHGEAKFAKEQLEFSSFHIRAVRGHSLSTRYIFPTNHGEMERPATLSRKQPQRYENKKLG